MNKPNHPDEIWLGKQDYSVWKDWRVNGWLFVATIISALCDIVFRSEVRQWTFWLQVVVAILPFIAILFWMRSLARWVRGMDELHRRITSEAILFTTSATFLFVMVWHRLDKVGVFQAIFPGGHGSDGSWDIGTVGHVFLLLTFFYFLGYYLTNRRYQ
jgi:hypothetical protein